MSFDVFVRNFFDTDANPVVIVKFTNCNMDPATNNFIAKKIGSSNGEFALISKYIMVEMNEDAPISEPDFKKCLLEKNPIYQR